MGKVVKKEFHIQKEAEYQSEKWALKESRLTNTFSGTLVADIMVKHLIGRYHQGKQALNEYLRIRSSVQMKENDKVLEIRKIIEATKLISSDYNIQVSVLPSFVHIPDEIALIFDEVINGSKFLFNMGLINEIQYCKLKNLDERLNALSAEAWSLDSLKNSEEWNMIRNTAKEVLQSFNESIEAEPELFWIKYVQKES